MNKTNKTYWPHAIIVFFLIVFTFNFYFLYQAIISNKGYVEDDTYNKSINYQDVINLKKSSKEFGIKVSYEVGVNYFNVNLSKLSKIKNVARNYKIILIPLSFKGSEVILEGSAIGIKEDKLSLNGKVNLKKGQWLFKFYFLNSDKKDIFLFEDKFLAS